MHGKLTKGNGNQEDGKNGDYNKGTNFRQYRQATKWYITKKAANK